MLLKKNEIKHLPLQTSHAFHSASFNPILSEFALYVNSFKKNGPKNRVISSLTGEFLSTEQAISGEYWAEQLRNTVFFYKGISTILSSENVLFVEVGPNAHLTSILKNIPETQTNASTILTLGKADSEFKNKLIDNIISKVWTSFPNFIPNLNFIDSEATKINLPQYPFDHKSYWIDFKIKDLNLVSSIDFKQTKKININANEEGESLRDKIKSILSDLSGLSYADIQSDKKFEDFGFDSLFLVRFAMSLENEFKCKIEFRKLVFEFPNIDTLSVFIKQNSNLDVLSQKLSIRKSYLDNFTPFSKEGNDIPLIIVHGDDLNVHLSNIYNKKRPYFGFLHLSADGHKNPFSSVQTMAAHYLKQLLLFKPQGPYILGGFSFGGILAFEMALQLEKLGHKVPLLFIMDCGTAEARVRYDNVRAKKEAADAPKVLEKIVYIFKKYYYKFYYISIRLFRNGLFLVLKKLPVQHRRKYVYDIYTNLSLKYKINGKFNGGVVVFKASENHSDMDYLGWDKYAENIHELVVMKGNHESVLKDNDTLKLILKKIDFYINKISSNF
ncbi:MAG: acyltransferase domain-containing protein [Bacteroidales bacterium]|nr:acyltransferase domain-containing protein [Bacteroidales bacterium]